MMIWSIEDAAWTAAVDRADGLVLLTHAARAPELAGGWTDRVLAIEHTYAEWAATLSPVALVLDSIQRPDASTPVSLLAIATMRA